MSESHAESVELRTELERRLDIIEAPGYEDSARRPLAMLDVALLTAFVAAVSVLSYLALY